MARLPCLLEDLIEEVIRNKVPIGEGGLPEGLLVLLGNQGAQFVQDFLSPEGRHVGIAHSPHSAEVVYCLPDGGKVGPDIAKEEQLRPTVCWIRCPIEEGPGQSLDSRVSSWNTPKVNRR